VSDEPLQDYWDALKRIVEGKPERVLKGGRINNDQVSIEAGRGRGSIKSGREEFADLIDAIKKAEKKRKERGNEDQEKYERRRTESEKYKLLYQQSIAREISLARENEELKEDIKKLKKSNIHSIKGGKKKS